MTIDLRQLSRTISHALRHEPWLYELELDEEGWVNISELLSALKNEKPFWTMISIDDLRQMMAESSKKRYEIKDDKIRALYGHSTPNKLKKQVFEPPEILYHGTSKETSAIILKEGLKPMRRQYVHLSADVDTAQQVARRKSQHIVILKIYAKKAYESRVKFYMGNAHVWLADKIPAVFIV